MIKNILKITFFEIKLFFREISAIFWTIFFPILILIIFGTISTSYTDIKINIGIYDQDNSASSISFIQKLKNNNTLSVEVIDDMSILKERVTDKKYTFGILLPKMFGSKIENNNNPTFDIYFDEDNEKLNSFAFSVLNTMLMEEMIDIKDYENKIDYRLHEIRGRSSSKSYIDFLIPGLIGLIILTSSFFSVASKILGYRESGILKQYFVMPISKLAFFLSQGFSNLLIVVFQAFVLIVMGILLYNVKIPVHVIEIILYISFGFIVFMLISVFISGFSKSSQGGINLINLIVFPLMFLSGIYFPVNQMPVIFKFIAYISPLTYFLDGLRELFLANPSWGVFYKSCSILGLWLVISLFFVSRKFEWIEK
ncbi:MAG: ABC transporter permease [Atribacterota bacterium]